MSEDKNSNLTKTQASGNDQSPAVIENQPCDEASTSTENPVSKITDQFSDLSMKDLIGGPLKAAAEHQAEKIDSLPGESDTPSVVKAPSLQKVPVPQFIMDEAGSIIFDREVKESPTDSEKVKE